MSDRHFDITPWAIPLDSGGDAAQHCLRWDEPRDVASVVAHFPGGRPRVSDLRVEYWRKNWPIADPESMPGALRGWIGQDDPFHGTWTRARGAFREQDGVVFTFDPLDAAELPDIPDLPARPGYLAPYRRTLKVRLVVPDGVGQPTIRAFSAARELTYDLMVRAMDRHSPWEPDVSVVNGELTARENNSPGLIRLAVHGTDARSGSPDSTLVTFRERLSREGARPLEFTFSPADVRSGPLWVSDFGIYVTCADNDRSFEDYRAETAAARRQPIYDRVRHEPEQTWQRASVEVPHLDPLEHPPYGRYVVLGHESGELKFGLLHNGNVLMGKRLLRVHNRLTAHLRWPADDLQVRIGTGDPVDFDRPRSTQRLERGFLPVVHTRWRDRDISYEQTAFATLLEGDLAAWQARRGDEAPVMLTTLTATNTTKSSRRACIWLRTQPDEALEVRDHGVVVARGYLRPSEYSPAMRKLIEYDGPALRGTVRLAPSGDPVELRAVPLSGGSHPNAVLHEVTLEPGESVSLDIRLPLHSDSDAETVQTLVNLDAAEARTEVQRFWTELADGRGSITCPADENEVGDFIRAVPSHILLSAFKDDLAGEYVLPAGAFLYGACGNEAAWQIVALDTLGHHDRARAYLGSLLAVQGSVMPDGDFTSCAGALQAVDFDYGRIRQGGFNYNLDHGNILQALIRHYELTGDREWLSSVAPNIVAACDFITRERQATAGNDDRTRGLLPPGHLEDNPEWRYWFAVNAHAYGGLVGSARALDEIGHPDVARLAAEAKDYREVIASAAQEARILSPVVRLQNGTAIPHLPTRAEIRGREWGWIREAGYGPLHLWEGGVLSAESPEITWVLQDLEDNLFVTREFGYGIDVDNEWFSRGGLVPQPNLMGMVKAYLDRDEIEHALRAFYNALAFGLYRDVRTLAEWVSEPGHGSGPFYKPSDEARMATWLRHLLVTELDDTLWLGRGVPRAWHRDGERYGITRLPTRFGQVTYDVHSDHGRTNTIRAEIRLSLRRAPERIAVRFRGPDAVPPVAFDVHGLARDAAFDVDGETVFVRSPQIGETTFSVEARYA